MSHSTTAPDHSPMCGVQLAIACVNLPTSRVTDLQQLKTFAHDHYLRGSQVDRSDIPEVQRVQQQLRTVLTADSIATASEILNTLVSEFTAEPRLVRHDGLDWHVDWHPRDSRLPGHILAQTVIPLMDYVAEKGLQNIKTCAAADCDRLFEDRTRNHSKRFCDSGTCGTRTHVAAFRARQARQTRQIRQAESGR